MSRSTIEWQGKNDDSPIPPRVRLRVFERHGGICALSGRRIRPGEPWQCDHIIALINGGTHHELNLCPVLVGPHAAKTRRDVALKAENYRVRKAHLGIKKPSRFACARSGKFKQKIGGQVILR